MTCSNSRPPLRGHSPPTIYPFPVSNAVRVAGTSATHTPFTDHDEHAGMKELTMRNGEVVDADTDDPDVIVRNGRVYSDRELTPAEIEQVDAHLEEDTDA